MTKRCQSFLSLFSSRKTPSKAPRLARTSLDIWQPVVSTVLFAFFWHASTICLFMPCFCFLLTWICPEYTFFLLSSINIAAFLSLYDELMWFFACCSQKPGSMCSIYPHNHWMTAARRHQQWAAWSQEKFNGNWMMSAVWRNFLSSYFEGETSILIVNLWVRDCWAKLEGLCRKQDCSP